MNTKTRLIRILDDIFKLNGLPIQDEWTSDDIANWDSLGHLNLIMALEKEFNITFEIDEMFAIESISDCVKMVTNKIKVK